VGVFGGFFPNKQFIDARLMTYFWLQKERGTLCTKSSLGGFLGFVNFGGSWLPSGSEGSFIALFRRKTLFLVFLGGFWTVLGVFLGVKKGCFGRFCRVGGSKKGHFWPKKGLLGGQKWVFR